MKLEAAKAIIRDQADMGSLGHAAGLVLERLERVEKAAREWTDARVRDGHMLGHSVIPTAQRLLDALEETP